MRRENRTSVVSFRVAFSSPHCKHQDENRVLEAAHPPIPLLTNVLFIFCFTSEVDQISPLVAIVPIRFLRPSVSTFTLIVGFKTHVVKVKLANRTFSSLLFMAQTLR